MTAAEPVPCSLSKYPVIKTTQGSVQGVASDYREGITVYKGIPFAASAAGENRRKEPSSRVLWTGVLKADTFGPQCAQTTSSTAGIFNTASNTTSEDCLHLNIWTPTYTYILHGEGSSSTLFGSNGGCAISFPINGPKGERINGVGFLNEQNEQNEQGENDLEVGLGGIQILTDYERSATLAPLHYQRTAVVEPIQMPPLVNTITGFVVVEKAYENTFIQFGTQCQQCDEQPMMTGILDRECHRMPNEQLEYDQKFSIFIDALQRGSFQTYASLKGVRRIQASTGIQGRCRSSSRISGLRFEYYNHPTPSIVGQWMNELDDGFELSRGEEVRSLNIWLTPVGFSRRSWLIEICQVIAIRIETTHSRSVIFSSSNLQALPLRKQHHRDQSDSDRKLIAISWVLNLNADFVRGVKRDTGSRRPQVLVPEILAPFDQVQKLYFEKQDGGSCEETVVTAEAYFQEGTIVGLSFVYTSGQRASIGELAYEVHQRVHFARDTRIVGFSITATRYELLGVEFEVERNQQPRYQQLRLSLQPPAEPLDTDRHEIREIWCRDKASAESYEHPPRRSAVFTLLLMSRGSSGFG